MYYFDYGPGCADKAGGMWGSTSPYWEAGGWGSHASEVPFVFGAPIKVNQPDFDLVSGMCDPRDEVARFPGASPRLLTVIQDLWTSYAVTGIPTTDRNLFTTPPAEGAEQWPACGPNAMIGESSDEPVLRLGVTIGIETGLKDGDCGMMHEHIKAERSNAWPLIKGFFLAGLFVGAAVSAVKLEKLPMPTKASMPEPVYCEITARVSTVATLGVSVLLVLLPWLAPHGAIPLVLAVICACTLLLRDARVMVAVGVLVFIFGWYNVQQMLGFSLASMEMGEKWGSHNMSSTLAVVLTSLLTLLFIVMPCSFCCAAKGDRLY